MDKILGDLRIVEIPAFVAAPLGGMTLAQLGAEVIRIDPIGGGIDRTRWPVTKDGHSLYWASLNKAKKSVCLALDKPEGRELAVALATAPGAGGGILSTNLGGRWMDYGALAARRADLIMLRLTGNADGGNALDYSVNCASGFPSATGRGGEPVNHVLPAWDVAAGLYLATGLLAAERRRTRTGKGQHVTLALSDVMLATVGNLGYLAEVEINGVQREPIGNDVYGAFGRDFPTADGRRVMVVAITTRQFKALTEATGLAERIRMIGPMMQVDLDDEGGRFLARDAIAAVLAPWFAVRPMAEIREALDGGGVLWGPYQDFRQLLAEDPRCSLANPLFQQVEHPEIGRHLMPGSPLSFRGEARLPVASAPILGQHTNEVLASVLGLSASELAGLSKHGVIGS